MKRTEFLKSLKLGSGALFSIYCLGSITSCTNEDTPLPSGNGNPDPISNGKVDFTLDLMLNTNTPLNSIGGFIYNGNIIITRAKDGAFVALSKVCTHAGTTIEYQKDTNDFYCPNHGSKFDISGKVIRSPADMALKMYSTQLLDSGNRLRVFEA